MTARVPEIETMLFWYCLRVRGGAKAWSMIPAQFVGETTN